MSDTIHEDVDSRPASTADIAPVSQQQTQQSGTAEVVREMEGGSNNVQNQSDAPLFPPEEADQLRGRWQEVQASFVDEPRQAVQQADELVANAIKRLAQTFADERSQLEGQWDRGESVSTEDLRLALQKYRTFFGRLLTV